MGSRMFTKLFAYMIYLQVNIGLKHLFWMILIWELVLAFLQLHFLQEIYLWPSIGGAILSIFLNMIFRLKVRWLLILISMLRVLIMIL